MQENYQLNKITTIMKDAEIRLLNISLDIAQKDKQEMEKLAKIQNTKLIQALYIKNFYAILMEKLYNQNKKQIDFIQREKFFIL